MAERLAASEEAVASPRPRGLRKSGKVCIGGRNRDQSESLQENNETRTRAGILYGVRTRVSANGAVKLRPAQKLPGIHTCVTHEVLSYCGLMGYNTVQSGRWVSTFRRNTLPSASG